LYFLGCSPQNLSRLLGLISGPKTLELLNKSDDGTDSLLSRLLHSSIECDNIVKASDVLIDGLMQGLLALGSTNTRDDVKAIVDAEEEIVQRLHGLSVVAEFVGDRRNKMKCLTKYVACGKEIFAKKVGTK
jgi:hypothetical protein